VRVHNDSEPKQIKFSQTITNLSTKRKLFWNKHAAACFKRAFLNV
jgi:hypothetical protein